MKAVLLSVQPYWVFLIIAKKMGWDIEQEKTIEVRKSFPKDKDWNGNVKLYCSKDKKSFNRIPKQYQPLMKDFLGKVIGEFNCIEITVAEKGSYCVLPRPKTMLDALELMLYANEKPVYGWHISDLVIYDEPKEFYEFEKPCPSRNCEECEYFYNGSFDEPPACEWDDSEFTRPPQSWCYIFVREKLLECVTK